MQEASESDPDQDFVMLRSNEGTTFSISAGATRHIKFLTNLISIEKGGAFTSIADDAPIVQMADTNTLRLVLQWCEFHKNSPPLDRGKTRSVAEADSDESEYEQEDMELLSREYSATENEEQGDGQNYQVPIKKLKSEEGPGDIQAAGVLSPEGQRATTREQQARVKEDMQDSKASSLGGGETDGGRESPSDAARKEEEEHLMRVEAVNVDEHIRKYGKSTFDFNQAFFDVDNKTLYYLLVTANFLEIEEMLTEGAKRLANLIKGKTAAQMSKSLDIC